jgi:hypothetical protein
MSEMDESERGDIDAAINMTHANFRQSLEKLSHVFEKTKSIDEIEQVVDAETSAENS